MSSSAEWFADDAALLGTLRDGRGVRTPMIAGYGELKELRRGGQGVVYLARQIGTKRRVAIKVLLDGAVSGETSRRRFEREIDLIASLSHPNIVKIFDSGVAEDGRQYYVMEFIDGASLDELIAAAGSALPAVAAHDAGRSAGLDVRAAADAWNAAEAGRDSGSAHHMRAGSPARGGSTPFPSIAGALRLFVKICEAVNYAHQRGVIHRDLKPSNVRIDPQGEPHVLDFGLAKLAGTAADADLTQMSQTGHFMGSLPWASPEQTEGSPSRIDIRTDVYSLGVMLYQLLTGQFPYPVTGSLRGVLENIQRAEPRRPSALRREIDEEIDTIVLKCLAKEPERRYQSAGELARDLHSYLAGEPIAAKRDSAWYGLRKNLARYRVAARVMSAAVILVLAFAAGLAYLWQRAAQAEQLATQRLSETEAARQAEQRARQDAEHAAVKANKTVDFLEATLQFVDPWKHPGRDRGPLREMLDQAARRVDRELGAQPEVEARVRHMLAWSYWELGLYDDAEPHLYKALELTERELGPDHERTLVVLNNVAMFAGERGRHPECVRLYEKMLAAARRVLGDEHPVTLRSANNLAAELVELGRFAEAQRLARQTLEAEQRVLNPQNESIAATMNTLVTALLGLAQYGEAEALAREIVDLRTAALGASAPPTLKAIGNLGYVLRAAGKLAEAEALLRETRERLIADIGPGHPTTIVVTDNLAGTLDDRGAREEAEALLREALAAQIAFSGRNSLEAARRLNNLGHVLLGQAKYEEAETLLREAVAISSGLEGERGEGTMYPRNNLAVVMERTGRHREAEELYRFVVAARHEQLGPEAESTLVSQINLGLLLVDTGRAVEAEPMLAQTMDAAARLWPSEHTFPVIARYSYGRCLVALGRLDEAETILTDAHARFVKAFGPTHDRTRRSAKALATLYEARGDSETAGAFRAIAGDVR